MHFPQTLKLLSENLGQDKSSLTPVNYNENDARIYHEIAFNMQINYFNDKINEFIQKIEKYASNFSLVEDDPVMEEKLQIKACMKLNEECRFVKEFLPSIGKSDEEMIDQLHLLFVKDEFLDNFSQLKETAKEPIGINFLAQAVTAAIDIQVIKEMDTKGTCWQKLALNCIESEFVKALEKLREHALFCSESTKKKVDDLLKVFMTAADLAKKSQI